ncbi:VanZ family protein [Microbacterium profundi]|uniref:VanZ family protein n=1 Tax=Microbacterium profundi TaxID=450380 RepID=A0ABV3LJH5_9MICO|nr:VanZ family protein [Microbacterium profundi]
MPTPAPRPRWVLWALVAYAAAAGILLLSPIGPGRILEVVVEWMRDDVGIPGFRQGWIEAPANVVLFIPLGFLLTLLFRKAWAGVLLALVLSVSAELVQALLPARSTSARDVVANALGAVIGAVLAWLFVVLRRGRIRRGSAAPRGTRADPR